MSSPIPRKNRASKAQVKRKRRVEAQALEQDTPGCVLVFGSPYSGVSTLCRTLQAASMDEIQVLEWRRSTKLLSEIESLSQDHLVLLDVDGGLLDETDIQILVDAAVINTTTGAVIRVHSPAENILSRLTKDECQDYLSAEDLVVWERGLSPIEARIRSHSLQYYMISNHDLENAVQQLALRCGVRD